MCAVTCAVVEHNNYFSYNVMLGLLLTAVCYFVLLT
jgi:hypothetical protein